MKKQSIKKLYDCIEKEKFEAFKSIIKEARDGNVFELCDIDKLCDVFLIDWTYIEPFQYKDVQRLIVWSMEKADKEKGMEILCNKLNEIAEKKPIHIQSFLNFLINGYSKEEIYILALNLNKYEAKGIFIECLLLLKDTKDEEKIKKIEEMLKILQKEYE